MARYRGPRVRILRRLGADLPGLTTKSNSRRPTPPGQAAAVNKRFPKLSEYGARQREKQKLMFHYGLSGKQMSRFYDKARRMPGDTGRNLIALLEARLDNLVWRSGFTRTLPAARQLVAHGHIDVDGHRAKTSSQTLKPGQIFGLRAKGLNREDIRMSVNNPVAEVPVGLKVDLDKLAVTVETVPVLEQCPIDVDMQKVIEFYSR